MTPTPTRPTYPDMIVNNLPSDLTERDQWVGWVWAMSKGTWTKIPKNPATGRNAKTSDPATWGSFAAALAYATRHGCGIGYVLCADDPFVGIDFDHVVDPVTGEIEPGALARIRALDSYTDLSPRDGAKVIVRATKPGHRCVNRAADIEMYAERRLFTLTGRTLAETPATIEPRQDALTALYRDLFGDDTPATAAPRTAPTLTLADEEIIAAAERISPKFSRLWNGSIDGYPSHSEARSGLVYVLAGYTKDPAQLDRLFMASGLYREDKWPRERDRVIGDALRDVTWQYDPTPKPSPSAPPPAPAVTRAADSDDAGEACGAERARIAELEARVAALEAERDAEREGRIIAEDRYWTQTRIILNPNLTPGEAIGAVVILNELQHRIAAGEQDEDGWIKVSLGALSKGYGRRSDEAPEYIDPATGEIKEADRPRLSRSTVSRQLKRFEEWGIVDRYVDEDARDEKGRPKSELYVRPCATTRETMLRLGTIKPEKERTHGGYRPPKPDPRPAKCPEHPDSDVFVTEIACAVCQERHRVDPPVLIAAPSPEDASQDATQADVAQSVSLESKMQRSPSRPRRHHPRPERVRLAHQDAMHYVPQEPAWVAAAMED